MLEGRGSRRYGQWLRVIPTKRRFSEDVCGKQAWRGGRSEDPRLSRSSGDWRKDKEARSSGGGERETMSEKGEEVTSPMKSLKQTLDGKKIQGRGLSFMDGGEKIRSDVPVGVTGDGGTIRDVSDVQVDGAVIVSNQASRVTFDHSEKESGTPDGNKKKGTFKRFNWDRVSACADQESVLNKRK